MVQGNTFGAAIIDSFPELSKYQGWKSSCFKIISCFQKVIYARGKQTKKSLSKSVLCMSLTLTRNVSSRILIWRSWGGWGRTDCFLHCLE